MVLSIYGSQQSYTSDGVNHTGYFLPEGRVTDIDYVVRVNGTLKVLGTDYIVNRDQTYPRVQFITAAPTAGQAVTINRQTPRQTPKPSLTTGEMEQIALWMCQEALDAGVEGVIGFDISPAKLTANLVVDLVSPVQGRVSEMTSIVEAAITTGGTIVPQVGTTNIAGWAAHSHAAKLAKGDIVTSVPADNSVATAFVMRNGRLRLVLAGFATAGELNGILRIRPYA